MAQTHSFVLLIHNRKQAGLFFQFVLFALSGAVGTLAHYSVMYLLVEREGFDPVTASGFGASVGLVVNYTLNYRLTFRSAQSHTRAFPKFFLVAGLGLGLNVLLMALLVEYIHWYYLYAQIAVTLIVLFWNFLANRFWTFLADHSTREQVVRVRHTAMDHPDNLPPK